MWTSHILVSHRDAGPDPYLRPVSWTPDTRPQRSRAEALLLARRIAEEAAAHPERFEALAREHSDDEVTRSSGGSLGGVAATQLPPVFLDAVTMLHPGEVSRPLETRLGFHILLRRSAPPHEDVEGRRVVIRYAGTLSSIDESKSERSREDARNIANSVAAQARDPSIEFESLVSQYSEHADRACVGDMGVWSTLEPGDKPREVETLSRLKVGETAPPLDSLWGFQVIQRLAPAPHDRYAMAAIRLKYGPLLPPEDSRSRPRVQEDARRLAQRLHREPAAFASEHGEQDQTVDEWEWGHGSPQVTLALERLRFGEVAAEPVATPFFFVVPMRLDPALVRAPERPPSAELPLRATPDLERVFHDTKSEPLSDRIAEFMKPEVSAALRLSVAEQAAFHLALEKLQKDVRGATTAEARVQSYRISTKSLHDNLSEATYSRLTDFIEQQAARMVMANP